MAERQSFVDPMQTLTIQEDAKRVAPIENLPVELLAHIFSFVDVVFQKRSELVCQLWKDVLRSPVVRTVVWIKQGPEWCRVLHWKNPEKISTGDTKVSWDFGALFRERPAMHETNPEVRYNFLQKFGSEHTQKIVYTGRIEPIPGYDVAPYFDWLWGMLDKGNRDGKPRQKIILHDVRIDLRSLVEASIWKSPNGWSLEGTKVELVNISSTRSGTDIGYFSPGFSVTVDKLKLHFSESESPQENKDKIWTVISEYSVVTSAEFADLERYWGDQATEESCQILRLREPVYHGGVSDLKGVEWKTLKPSTLREIATCIDEKLKMRYGLHYRTAALTGTFGSCPGS